MVGIGPGVKGKGDERPRGRVEERVRGAKVEVGVLRGLGEPLELMGAQ